MPSCARVRDRVKLFLGDRIGDRFSLNNESYDESISDYGEFLRENKRYQPMLEADTLDEQIMALGKSGYATDPDYAKKIAAIAKSKRLEALMS